ncbi:Protein of unknown function [Jatrophihabitans endophyticus]|uniref:DUF998 domain-containing protein n=1 Tax=Jatrophihabitans endophyticus TaxID=1206085 RepID=A0A1M5T020_9ACTN|nr:Protein of unknown function [Jatrophihabitans endophyticus]
MTGWRRWALRGGAGAGPIFLIISTVDGATRDGYSARRHPVSSLVLGTRKSVQTANFAVTGTLCLAGAAGLRHSARRPNAVSLVAITAASAGIFLASLFATDPVNGYPPGTRMPVDQRPKSGIAHDAVSIPTFLGLPVAAASHSMASARQGNGAWAVGSGVVSVTMLASLAAATAGFSGSQRWSASAGYWQRLCVADGLLWLGAVMARALRPT